MYLSDKDYLIIWYDSVFDSEIKVIFKGNKVVAALREINKLDTTHLIQIEEI